MITTNFLAKVAGDGAEKINIRARKLDSNGQHSG